MKILSPSEVIERRKINSTSPLKKILEERLAETEFGVMVPHPLTKDQMEAIQRVRASKARLRAQGEPLAGKRNAPDYLPTPQRMAKGGLPLEEQVDPAYGRRYRRQMNAVETYKGKWGDEVEYAFMRLVDDSRASDIRGITINYSPAGSRAPGLRLGGVQAAQLEAYTRFQMIMDALPRRAKRVAEWVLLPRDASDPPMTLEEVGRYVFPHIRTEESCRNIGLGYLSALGDRLVQLYGDYDMDVRTAEIRVRDMRTIKQVGAR